METFLIAILLAAVLGVPAYFWWPFRKIRYLASRHLRGNTSEVPTLGRSFANVDLPNIERALREIDPNGRRIGIGSNMIGFRTEELATILNGNARAVGVRTESVTVAANQTMACMVNSLLLVTQPVRAVVYVGKSDLLQKLEVEIAAVDPKDAEKILERISEGCGRSSVYKGQIISFTCDQVAKRGQGCFSLRFHEPSKLASKDVILPEATLSLIERNTIGFFDKLEKLRATGRSVKRGILLYGRPGTGKTLTAKWVSSAIPGLTTLFLSADQLFLIKDCCQMARMLAPSLVVLEDVDLIARDRGREENLQSRITLNQLLNEMDGVSDNSGVLFLLTTNRPEELELALAARPGRIDQAIEYPLPDADCRERLFETYLSGLERENLDLSDLVRRTDGAPPAFIEELVRKALSTALLENDRAVIRQDHFSAALRELLFTGGDLTRRLLGFTEPFQNN
ncbi:MAG TPA: ATP-binding protein [Fimbriimonas sp.]|nr:ATP-binding protein [Fimbriimonas sp.]